MTVCRGTNSNLSLPDADADIPGGPADDVRLIVAMYADDALGATREFPDGSAS
jgi:hypothetical protein